MKYLIFGSQGTVGQALVELLGHNAIAVSRNDCDISNEQAVRNRIEKHRPDVLINAAAYNAVDACEQDEQEKQRAWLINATAPGMLANICKENNIIFVHYSTDYVFSGKSDSPYTEDAHPDPINVYGESKAAGEQAVQEQGEKYYIIRLSRVFGKKGSGESSKRSFVDTMLWLATEGGKDHLEIVDTEVASPSYAPDVADFTKQLIENNAEWGIYHCVNEGECSWYEFANTAFDYAGISIDTSACGSDKFPRPAKRPQHSTLVNTKALLLRTWQEALKEYIQP